MSNRKLTQEQKEEFLNILRKFKEDGLYRKLIGQAFYSLPQEPNPEIVLMDFSDWFFILYRQTGEEDYFRMGKIFRRAAHTVYRELFRQNKRKKRNTRFLTMVNL